VDFFARLRLIFELDLDELYAKKVFKKICNNPDCYIEWSEIFGYNLNGNDSKTASVAAARNKNNAQSGGHKEEPKAMSEGNFLDEIQIFLVSFKYRFGDAGGDKAKRDIIQAIYYAADIDSFITVALKGAVSIWNNKVID
jgi:hypothetical protein